MYSFKIDASNKNKRVDKYLSENIPSLTRNKIALSIDEGNLLVNGKKEKASYKLKENDDVSFNYSFENKSTLIGENIPLDIIYEDEDIAIINKPQGLVVHPGAGNHEHTLANALKAHFDSLSSINGEFRPGIVHRIDKDTCGLICVAKNDSAHLFLSEQLKDHTMNREYIALVKGVINENSGKIDLPIARSKQNRLKMEINRDGKSAITYFSVLKRFSNHTLVKCKLLTGRTHQIRVHFAYISHPVEGDILYNKKNATSLWKQGQLLCAVKLNLIHPRTKKEMSFEIDLPQFFKDIIDNLI